MPDGIVQSSVAGSAPRRKAPLCRPCGAVSALQALAATTMAQDASNGPQGRLGAPAPNDQVTPGRLDAIVTLPGEPATAQAPSGHPKLAAGTRRPAPCSSTEVTR